MIIQTGGRTDTVQYFSEWLLRRFDEGYVYSRNPQYPSRVTRYSLSPDTVDCVVFCSKNYAPILPHLQRITSKFATFFQYTITAYGKDIEPGVPDIDQSMDTLRRLSALVGRQRLVWRYDPVLLTGPYTIDRHLKTFDRMAQTLAPHVRFCVFSFVQLYAKVTVNMPGLQPVSDADKDTLAREMGAIAARHGLPLQTCGPAADYTKYGVGLSGCLTLDMVGEANGLAFRRLKHNGMREGCRCMEWRDIGWYDTCLNGCRYCYANQRPAKAFENFKYHDPASPLLLGHLREGDILRDAAQKSFAAPKGLF